MRNIPNKTDNTTVLPAEDFNSINDELRTIIEKGGQVIPGPDNQIAKSVSNHVAMADFYLESGAADAYVLNIANTAEVPTQFFDGLRVRFVATFTNTGDPGGVTVNLPSLGPKPVKKFNGEVLGDSEIVADEMTELLFLKTPKDFFIVSSSSNTRMITRDTQIGVAAVGQQFTNLHDAYESIRNKYILDSVTVTFDLLGQITETEPTTISHSEGNNIKITGFPSTLVNITAVNSVSGMAGAFSVEYAIDAPLGLAVVGDYITIHDIVSSGPDVEKQYGRKHEGIWKVTAITGATVTVTNKFGFAMGDALKTNDLSSGQATFTSTRLDYTAVAAGGLTIKNTNLNQFSDITFLKTTDTDQVPFTLENASIDLAGSFLGVVSETIGAIVLEKGGIINGSIAAISDTNLPLKMTSSKINNVGSVILNGSGEAEGTALLMEDSYLGGDAGVLVVCGNAAGSATAIPAINIRKSSFKLLSIITVANRSIGFFMKGAQGETVNLLSADNDIGCLIEAASSFEMLDTAGKLLVLDNTRGSINFGFEVASGSYAQIGRENTNTIFVFIDTIKLAGHAVGHDAQALNGGGITLGAIVVNSNAGRINVSTGGTITRNVPVVAETGSGTTASFIAVF